MAARSMTGTFLPAGGVPQMCVFTSTLERLDVVHLSKVNKCRKVHVAAVLQLPKLLPNNKWRTVIAS